MVTEFKKVCADCGKRFTSQNSKVKYCSDACRRTAQAKYSREYRKNNPELCKQFMHDYYLKHKEELNRLNAEYKKAKGIQPTDDQKQTWSLTGKLIRKGLIQEQDKCCFCGKGKDEARLLNHHSAGYDKEYSAYSLMRLCYGCHTKLHHSMRTQGA